MCIWPSRAPPVRTHGQNRAIRLAILPSSLRTSAREAPAPSPVARSPVHPCTPVSQARVRPCPTQDVNAILAPSRVPTAPTSPPGSVRWPRIQPTAMQTSALRRAAPSIESTSVAATRRASPTSCQSSISIPCEFVAYVPVPL
ncbi:hypothetical protein BV20DRAFT_632441 [Pilatotrama ljubarskyi]|nr:hypothetical protein BV20DRAFT_632441 [Pilatotrama ljubarskyi]